MQLFVDQPFLSPYAMSVFVTLTEKQIPFTLETVNLADGGHRSSDYAGKVLTQRVPALVDGDFVLSESSAMCEYLEDRFPDIPVYPTSLEDKALARQIQAWLRSDLMPIRTERSTEVVFLGERKPALSPAGELARDKLVAACLQWLKPDQDNLFGSWCIADTDLALMINRMVLNGDAVPDVMRVYAARQWQRPSVQAWVRRHR